MEMIKVTGIAKLKVPFEVNLDITEAEFETMSDRKSDELIENAIDWHSATRNAETDEIDVWEYEEQK